jgi:hypothetical protein
MKKLLALALLLVGVAVPATASAAGLKLEVAPKRADVGKKTCFTFSATRGGKAAPGAAVRFESAVAKTTRADGKVRSCVSLDYPGAHGAVVETGNEKASVRVKATRMPGADAAAPDWHWTHPFIQGYECNGEFGASSYIFSRPSFCMSVFLQDQRWSYSPMPNYGFYLRWSSKCKGCPNVPVKLEFPAGYYLSGTLPDRGSDRFTVTDGFFSGAGSGITSGSDPTKPAGEKGGPLSFDAVFRRDWTDGSGQKHSNYDFVMGGWLYY